MIGNVLVDHVMLATLFATVQVLEIEVSRAFAHRDFKRMSEIEPLLAASKRRYLAAVPHG